MTKKADFNAEEWAQITKAPPIAGMIVIASQRGGSLRETIEMSKAYADAREASTIVEEPELLDEIVRSNPDLNPREFSSPEELNTKGVQQLTDAISLLETKATADEIDAFRGFVLAVAERVAHRHKTGGFLGFGGHEVSDDEQAALDRIAAAMGTTE